MTGNVRLAEKSLTILAVQTQQCGVNTPQHLWLSKPSVMASHLGCVIICGKTGIVKSEVKGLGFSIVQNKSQEDMLKEIFDEIRTPVG